MNPPFEEKYLLLDPEQQFIVYEYFRIYEADRHIVDAKSFRDWFMTLEKPNDIEIKPSDSKRWFIDSYINRFRGWQRDFSLEEITHVLEEYKDYVKEDGDIPLIAYVYKTCFNVSGKYYKIFASC